MPFFSFNDNANVNALSKFKTGSYIVSTVVISIALGIVSLAYTQNIETNPVNLLYILLSVLYLVVWGTSAFFCGQQRSAWGFLIMWGVMWLPALVYFTAGAIDPLIIGNDIPFVLGLCYLMAFFTVCPVIALCVQFASSNLIFAVFTERIEDNLALLRSGYAEIAIFSAIVFVLLGAVFAFGVYYNKKLAKKGV